MSNQRFTYELGHPRALERERPTMADLQRAQAHALRRGDRRRAAAYELVIMHRLEVAQSAAGTNGGSQAA